MTGARLEAWARLVAENAVRINGGALDVAELASLVIEVYGHGYRRGRPLGGEGVPTAGHPGERGGGTRALEALLAALGGSSG